MFKKIQNGSLSRNEAFSNTLLYEVFHYYGSKNTHVKYVLGQSICEEFNINIIDKTKFRVL